VEAIRQQGWDGLNAAYLAVQDDGNVVVYQDGSPLWATNTGD
jgi:hypothetical protein